MTAKLETKGAAPDFPVAYPATQAAGCFVGVLALNLEEHAKAPKLVDSNTRRRIVNSDGCGVRGNW